MHEAADERARYARIAARVRGYGLRHLRDPQLAQELMQQVMLIVIEALREGRVEQVDRFEAYVLGTCRNVVMDMRRGAGRQRRLSDAAAAALPTAYEETWPRIERQRLEQCLERLAATERSVVLGTFIDDRDADELGRDLGVSAGNVRVIRHRSLAKLQRCIEGTGSAPS